MTLWVDAQISPRIAPWISETFRIDARPVREVGLLQAGDQDIFLAARAANAAVLTKDKDFVNLLQRLGPPPVVLWVTCGNTSNSRLRDVLRKSMPAALNLLRQGEKLVEISDAR